MRWSVPGLSAVLMLGCLHPASAALPCGEQPEVPAAEAPKLKADVETKSDLIRHAPASVNLRVLVTATRHELRDKYAEVEIDTVDHYLLWVTCQDISNDYSIAPTQRFDLYSTLYRLMSEKIPSGKPKSE